MKTITIQPKHWGIVHSILSQYPYQFYAFGSRVRGNPRKLSDLDLCYKENIPYHIVAKLQEAFEESNLPFVVDLVDFNNSTPEFQALLLADMVEIEKLQIQGE